MQPPIRLALIITELHPGGAERCLVELATGLDRSQFSPIVYSLGPKPPTDRQLLVGRLEQANVALRFLDLKSYWHYWPGVRRLAALLRDDQIDLCQAFLFHANILAARAALLARVPHFIAGIRVADPRVWRSTLERVVLSRADRIACVSQGVADFCCRRNFPAPKLVVIPNGIDAPRWQNAAAADLTRFGVPAGHRIFTYVGRLDPQKGLDRFFHELPALLAQIPDHDFLLVGEGPQARELLRLCTELNVQSRVHFAGWQSDIPGILAASDLLVLPSRWEGLPNVLLEAMAAGKPVVALRAEGVAEILGDACDRQTAPLNDFHGLAAVVARILHNANLAKDLGQANQRRVALEFALNSMVEKYQRLYFGLLQPPR